jgi:hypothetical protein
LKLRSTNPHIRSGMQLMEVYGRDILDGPMISFSEHGYEMHSREIVRQTRLNPRLESPIFLIECWDGSVSLKQENFFAFQKEHLADLEEALRAIAATPEDDYRILVGHLLLTYEAERHRILFQDKMASLNLGGGSLAVLKHLITALKLQEAAPVIKCKE